MSTAIRTYKRPTVVLIPIIIIFITHFVWVQTTDAIKDVETFQVQIKEFRDTFNKLNITIDEKTKQVESLNDVDQSRKHIEQLQQAVSDVLGIVVETGLLSIIGQSALDKVSTKIQELEKDTRFSKQERDILISS